MALLSAKNLSCGYDGREVVKGISFEVNKGDYLCIVGENGAGKSTLMKTILGLIEPVKGEIFFGDGLAKSEIGYLPQQTVVQKDFPASVEEIVLSGCQGHMGLRPFCSKEERARAEENMERMKIKPLAKKCYRNLSGGQQQRVLLARALCATGKLLLLDEPVSGLDPVVTIELYELVKSLNREGVTIIMISHDIAAALKYADHILHVDNDSFYGTTSEYVKAKEGNNFLPKQV